MSATKFAIVGLLLVGCSAAPEGTGDPSNEGNNGTDMVEPGTYAFPSRFEDGEDSVSYSGQIARHVLINDLASFIGGMNAGIDSGDFEVGAPGDVVRALDFYFRFDSDSYGTELIGLSTEPPTLQKSYNAISPGKDLVSKLAGNDTSTDFADFGAQFRGWGDSAIASEGGTTTTPEGLVGAFFHRIEANAIARADGVDRMGPDGTVLPVHLTEEGYDLQQLTQKFLLSAVAFHQGADDYLDDDVEGKGLKAPNGAPDEDGAAFSTLEHAWDEGFGYFGAARDYLDYSDDEIAGKGGRDDWSAGYHDTDGDGSIDLTAEFNFGASVNAGKRDRDVATRDFTRDAFAGFWRGRHIISSAQGELTAEEASALAEQRDEALEAWEGAIAATVVHYINETIEATQALGTGEYDFAAHAKGWSEMKGFALAFQFNRRSPLIDDGFDELHRLLRDAPELDESKKAAYIADLETARAQLGEAYGFSDEELEAW